MASSNFGGLPSEDIPSSTSTFSHDSGFHEPHFLKQYPNQPGQVHPPSNSFSHIPSHQCPPYGGGYIQPGLPAVAYNLNAYARLPEATTVATSGYGWGDSNKQYPSSLAQYQRPYNTSPPLQPIAYSPQPLSQLAPRHYTIQEPSFKFRRLEASPKAKWRRNSRMTKPPSPPAPGDRNSRHPQSTGIRSDVSSDGSMVDRCISDNSEEAQLEKLDKGVRSPTLSIARPAPAYILDFDESGMVVSRARTALKEQKPKISKTKREVGKFDKRASQANPTGRWKGSAETKNVASSSKDNVGLEKSSIEEDDGGLIHLIPGPELENDSDWSSYSSSNENKEAKKGEIAKGAPVHKIARSSKPTRRKARRKQRSPKQTKTDEMCSLTFKLGDSTLRLAGIEIERKRGSISNLDTMQPSGAGIETTLPAQLVAPTPTTYPVNPLIYQITSERSSVASSLNGDGKDEALEEPFIQLEIPTKQHSIGGSVSWEDNQQVNQPLDSEIKSCLSRISEELLPGVSEAPKTLVKRDFIETGGLTPSNELSLAFKPHGDVGLDLLDANSEKRSSIMVPSEENSVWMEKGEGGNLLDLCDPWSGYRSPLSSPRVHHSTFRCVSHGCKETFGRADQLAAHAYGHDVPRGVSQAVLGEERAAQENVDSDFSATSLIDSDDLPNDLLYDSRMTDTHGDMSITLSQFQQNREEVDSTSGNRWNSYQETMCSWVSNMTKSLFRPRVILGYRRVEWTCGCGDRLYADFKTDVDDIDRITTALQNLPHHLPSIEIPNSRGVPPGNLSATSVAPPGSSSSGSIFSRDVDGSSSLTDASSFSLEGENNTPISTFLGLCVNTGEHLKELGEINLTKARCDGDLFGAVREKYLRIRGTRVRSWLLKPTSVSYVRFSVEQRHRVGILQKPLAVPPKTEVDAKRWTYDPCPLEGEPPIPEHLFLHYLECPFRSRTLLWMLRLPRKLKTSILSDGIASVAFGWGVHIDEGPNYKVLRWINLVALVASGIFAALWSVYQHDFQGAFGFASWFIMVLNALMFVLMYTTR